MFSMCQEVSFNRVPRCETCVRKYPLTASPGATSTYQLQTRIHVVPHAWMFPAISVSHLPCKSFHTARTKIVPLDV